MITQKSDTPAAAPTGRLRSIDFLRGIAALGVMFFHAMQYAPLPAHSRALAFVHWISHKGQWGICLFFVLSGFCIHQGWVRKHTRDGSTKLDAAAYWGRRFWRLYPTYFVALCFSMSLIVIGLVMHRHAAQLDAYPHPQFHWVIADFVAHAFMLHGLSPTFDLMGGNPLYWTLAREWYLYALYFLLIVFRRKWGVYSCLALAVIPGIISNVIYFFYIVPLHNQGIIHADLRGVVGWSALAMWGQWTLGVLAVEAYYGQTRLGRWCSHPAMLIFWLGILGVGNYCLPTYYKDMFGAVLQLSVFGMLFFTLLNWLVAVERAGKWPENPLVAWFTNAGVFSYSIYLIHLPFCAIFRQALDMKHINQANPVIFSCAVVVLLIIQYNAARLLFFLVERHFLSPRVVKGQEYRRSEPTSVPDGASLTAATLVSGPVPVAD